MDTDSQLRRVAMQAPVRQEPALHVDGAVDSIARRAEQHEKPIACVVHLMAVMRLKAAAQLAVQPDAQVVPRGIADRLHQRRGACEVREHQRFARAHRPCLFQQGRAQVVAGANLELVVDMAQVVFDRLRAQVQLGRRLARG